MKHTEQQALAITTIDKNIAVNAGAGTGKTKVLTERYIYILENGILEKNKEVESIVAITFTRKATQEMRERIRDEIKKRFPKGDQWRRYYNDIEKANISTIHSFCSNILRKHALEANIDPMFNVLDGSEGDSLLDELVLKLILEGIEKNQNIYNMVKILRGDNLIRVVEEIKSVYYQVRNAGFSFEEVKNMTLDTIDSIEVDNKLIDYIRNRFVYLMDRSRPNSKVYRLKDTGIWDDFYNGRYEEDDLPSILEYLYSNIGSNAKEKETIRELEDAINSTLLMKEKKYRWLYGALLELLGQVDMEYTRVKDDMGVVDYDDLQILVLNLLKDETIKKKYQEKYRYIMIDEFQDTNELQKNIFYRLCTRDKTLDCSNLFIVGDPKQSIYGFRGADLEVFYDVMEDMESTSDKGAITLDVNFRTTNTVLKFINGLFQKLMGDRYTALTEYRQSKSKIDVEVLEKANLEIPKGISNSDYHRYYESKLIASRIRELADRGEYQYGDFVLLFRSTTSVHMYEEALEEYDIPHYNISGRGFYQNQEIIDITNGLKAISNRYDTLSTIGFLRSPMIGLSDKGIYWLLRYKKDNILDTMDRDIPYIEAEDRSRILKAKRILNELIVFKNLYSLSDTMKKLVDNTYCIETLLLDRGGKQLVANVYKFLEIARKFDEDNLGTLEDFIDHVEALKDTDEAQAKIESEDADVVRIMTIHKSKGLQFPVVILPQMSRMFNYKHPYALFDKEVGISFKYDDMPITYNRMRKEAARKENEENKRILYVAMTRAKDRLIVGNQGSNIGFKRMIKDILDIDQVKIMGDINKHENLKKPVQLIAKDLLGTQMFDYEEFPLVKEIPGCFKTTFSNFNASQYMEFSQCKRRFFMKYYKKMPIMDIQQDNIWKKSSKDAKKLDPIVRGNIVHKFCEYYREGMDIEGLINRILGSFGIEYSLEVREELNPYIENFLKHYRNDYTDFYIEKTFYLKVGDNYINGIIDRINIKDGKAQIIDYKTNRAHDKKELLKKYEPQLQLYAYAFQRVSNIKVKNASILFLETGELESIDIHESSLQENYRNMKEFIQFVTRHSSIEQYEIRTNCDGNCIYNVLCNQSQKTRVSG